MDNRYAAEAFNRFCNVIDDMIEIFDDLKAFEDKKLNAVIGNDVLRLEHLMNEEQAYLMKMRGLDQKREKLQEEMGLKGKNFRQIIEAAPLECREEMIGRKQALDEKNQALVAAVEKTKRSIEGHLQRLDQMMQQVQEESRGYDKSGKKEGGSSAPTRFKPTKA